MGWPEKLFSGLRVLFSYQGATRRGTVPVSETHSESLGPDFIGNTPRTRGCGLRWASFNQSQPGSHASFDNDAASEPNCSRGPGGFLFGRCYRLRSFEFSVAEK